MRDTQRPPLEPVVTIVKAGIHPILRVTYGPYNTTCKRGDVWGAKQQLKQLPMICPTCRKEIHA